MNVKSGKNSNNLVKCLHTVYYAGFFPKESDFEKYISNQLKKMTRAYEKLKGSSPLLLKPDERVFDFSEKDWSASIDLVEKLRHFKITRNS